MFWVDSGLKLSCVLSETLILMHLAGCAVTTLFTSCNGLYENSSNNKKRTILDSCHFSRFLSALCLNE